MNVSKYMANLMKCELKAAFALYSSDMLRQEKLWLGCALYARATKYSSTSLREKVYQHKLVLSLEKAPCDWGAKYKKWFFLS